MTPFDDPRRPVVSVDDLSTLDDAEIIEGYLDGRDGLPCGGNRSRSYWHGWRNGMVDSGRMGAAPEMSALAADFLAQARPLKGDDAR